MKISADVVIAEIGSTTTVVNAFSRIDSERPVFLGQGQAATTVLQGDVRNGLKEAVQDLCAGQGVSEIVWKEMLAASSAAGGLKMTVHGLVYDMTVKAAKEASLSAGAVIRCVTAGRLRDSDLEQIQSISPNLIMLAGGVDYGERDTALFNAERIRTMNRPIPVIYAGNIACRDEIMRIFEGYPARLYTVENVFPKIDVLNIEPARRVIQEAFEAHITEAPGMVHVREMVTGRIIPTPGAVMESAKLLYETMGDLLVADVGGATTDIHSVTEGSEEIARLLTSPEPFAKRTVEGDIGVFVNMAHIVERIGTDRLERELGFPPEPVMTAYNGLPKNAHEIAFVSRLTAEAVKTALERHAGQLRYIYGPEGRSALAEGKDLSMVNHVIGTGGALARLPDSETIILQALNINTNGRLLLPKKTPEILIDRDYVMATAGVLSAKYKAAALSLIKNSLFAKHAQYCPGTQKGSSCTQD